MDGAVNGLRVLLVEDYPSIVEIVKLGLRRLATAIGDRSAEWP